MNASDGILSKLGITHFLNGGLGGLTAGLIVQPLQVIKTAFQVKPYSHNTSSDPISSPAKNASVLDIAKFIYNQEGVRGLYRGLLPACLKSALSAATYFYLLNAARKIGDLLPSKSLGDLFAATVARTLQTFLINPIVIVKTRFEVVGFNEYKNMTDAFIQIYRKEGLKSFFTNGVTLALLKDVPFSAVQFPIYEQIKLGIISALGEERSKSAYNKSMIYATSSMIATFISCLLTNPLDVIRTRVVFQYYNKNKQQHYTGVLDAINKMLKYDGWSGLFFGLQSRFLKKVTGSMVAWTIYECLLDRQKERKRYRH